VFYARKPDELLTGIGVSHMALMLMVLYVGRRHEAAGALNILACLIVLGVTTAWPVVILFARTYRDMAGDLIVLGIYAAVLVVMPLICLLTHLAVKRSDNVRRGFPVLPIPPQHGREQQQ
jgi:hydrogenase-4 membrane subunit HyfE